MKDTATGPALDPTCIDAPIIVTAADRPALEAFMKGLAVDNRPVARLESTRLAPYWTTLSGYMADALARRNKASAEKSLKGPKLDELIQPQNLAALFNGVADYNRNTVLSQIAIVPDSFLGDEQLKEELFDGKALYGGNTLHHGRNFNFGFVQVYAHDEKGKAVSSISFPLLSLDTPMLEMVAPHRPQTLLAGLQTVMNSGNHDMLHHMTNEIVNSTISASFRREPWRIFFDMKKTNKPLWDWDRKYFSTGGGGDSHPLSYESWLIMTQQQVRGRAETQPGPQEGQVRTAVETVCGELKRISAELQKASPTPAEGARNAHRAVDYFGSMVAYALSRFQPITSPYIDTLLKAMEEAEPLTNAAEKECLLGLLWNRAHAEELAGRASAYADLETITGVLGNPGSVTALLRESLKSAKAASAPLRDTFAACAKTGQPLEPEDSNLSYDQLKRVGVVSISPWIARICTAPDSEAVAKPIARTPEAALDMIEALAKMLKFKPAPTIS